MSVDLRPDNPFAATGVIMLFKDDEMALDRSRLKYLESVNDKVHIIRDFDTLWDLSYDFYGSSRYWWILQDINQLENGFDLTMGASLIIPDFLTIKAILR